MISLLLFHLISSDEHSETSGSHRELHKVRENDHALVLMMRTVRATLQVYEGIGDLRLVIADSPTYSRACHSW